MLDYIIIFWLNNQKSSQVWDEIAYPFPKNFHRAAPLKFGNIKAVSSHIL